jgi:hypothetical protein
MSGGHAVAHPIRLPARLFKPHLDTFAQQAVIFNN